jgi:hypothetical protein
MGIIKGTFRKKEKRPQSENTSDNRDLSLWIGSKNWFEGDESRAPSEVSNLVMDNGEPRKVRSVSAELLYAEHAEHLRYPKIPFDVPAEHSSCH